MNDLSLRRRSAARAVGALMLSSDFGHVVRHDAGGIIIPCPIVVHILQRVPSQIVRMTSLCHEQEAEVQGKLKTSFTVSCAVNDERELKRVVINTVYQ